MLFTTTTQYVALAIALVAGWLFGLASHPGGRKWKARYAAEREANAAARKEQDARLAERDARVKELERTHDARVRELERENARLARAAPVTAATISPTAQAAARPATDRDHIRRERTDGRWFDWRNRIGTNG